MLYIVIVLYSMDNHKKEPKKYIKYSDHNRKCIIDAYQSDADWRSLCSAMNIKISTVYLWISKGKI